MKLNLLAGAALAAVFAASGVSAQETGWYGAVDLGYHWPQSVKTESDQNAPDGAHYHWAWKSEKDWTGFVRLGYQFNPNWRAEVEGGYRPGDLKSVHGPAQRLPVGLCTPGVTRTAAAPACGSPDGSIESWSLMANVIYDFAPGSWLNPFLGAGVGINRLDVKTLGQFSSVPGAITATNPAIQNLTVDDDDLAIAWQAIAGASIKATDKLKIDFTYRYITGGEHTWQSLGSNSLQPGAFEGQYRDQSVTVGLRYSFASPPPPPPPQYEAREFIVYFPFDQSVLTPEAQSVVSEAAKYSNDGHATKIVVVGHTDTSGSPKYNAKLSERRARAVADALASQGVPTTALAVDWKGESAPAVATGDGVKEPLNRRSTISINF